MQISHQITQAQNKQAVNHDYVMTSLMEFPKMQISHQIPQAQNKQDVNYDYVMTPIMEFPNDDSPINAM